MTNAEREKIIGIANSLWRHHRGQIRAFRRLTREPSGSAAQDKACDLHDFHYRAFDDAVDTLCRMADMPTVEDERRKP